MSRYLLDTNAMGDLMNRRHAVHVRAAEARKRGADIGTCEPVVAELYAGVENSATRDANLVVLRRTLAGLKCWPLDRRASEEFGRLFVALKRVGRLIGPIDMLTAAIALSLADCTVVTNDNDFQSVPDLKVENWRSEIQKEAP
jgi:tRNA(fMet)-specific endonuclease VapC